MPLNPNIASDGSNGLLTQDWQQHNVNSYSHILPDTGRTNVTAAVQNYQETNIAPEVLTFPSDRPKYFMLLDIGHYSNPSGLAVTMNSIRTIILPMPEQMTDFHGVSYSDEQLGIIAGGAINFATGSLGPFGAEGAPTTAAGIGSLMTGIAAPVIGTTIPAAVEAIAGLAPNQFTTILLKGPEYKRFQMEWCLAPKNFAEADTIREIIRVLQNAQAPGLAISGLVLKFPFIFQLSFIPNWKYLFRFKPAAIYNMQVNYNPGGARGAAFYHDPAGHEGDGSNPPESVTITLQFLELEYWLRNDFLANGDPTDVRAGGMGRYLDTLV